MDIKGKILEIFDTTRVSEKFQKREFVVEYAENPSYPEYIKFELIQDKCDLLNNLKPGDIIQVHFNLKGRKWTDPQGNDKYFNSLQAWKVEAQGGESQSSSSTPKKEVRDDIGQQQEPGWLSSEQDDDLPF